MPGQSTNGQGLIEALFRPDNRYFRTRCFVIAEAGVNHNGNIGLAHRLIDAAAHAGVDAVKFQSFKADRLVTADAPKADYQTAVMGSSESQLEMLRRLQLSDSAHRELVRHCSERGITFISTPFDEERADFLAELGVLMFKIPSGEITNLPYLEHIARIGRPMLVSTGMSNLGEVEEAVRTIQGTGGTHLALLHCVSNYPADPADVNLKAMETMRTAFGVPTGYSDHTLGNEVAFAAAALGACAIEKHFTLDRSLPGPDHASSCEPEQLSDLVRGIRTVESALGTGRKEPVRSESSTSAVARKSLVASRSLSAGTVISEDMIVVKRPGTGLPPAMRPFLIGRTIRTDIPEGALFTLDGVA